MIIYLSIYEDFTCFKFQNPVLLFNQERLGLDIMIIRSLSSLILFTLNYHH